MKKRILSFGMAILLSVGAVVPAFADDLAPEISALDMVGTTDLSDTADLPDTAAPIAAAASGTCGENLTWTLENGTLTISGTGAMDDYWTTNRPWEAYHASVTRIVIKEGVTTISSRAFANHISLKQVDIPSTVALIGREAFRFCLALESVNVAAGSAHFLSVDGVLFDKYQRVLYRYPSAKADTSYTVPSTVRTLENFAFEWATNLTKVVLNDGLVYIGEDAFASCSDLSDITIPNTVIDLGAGAFSHCDALVSMDIPASVETMGYAVFAHCTSLVKVTFYSKTTEILESTFEGTTPGFMIYGYTGSTAEAYAKANGHTFFAMDSDDNPPETVATGTCGEDLWWVLDSEDTLTITGTGAMDNWDPTGAPWFAYKDQIKAVVIEEGAASIGDHAFYQFSAMTTASIPEGVTTIGTYAFGTCPSLLKIEIPSSVTHIYFGAFAPCTSLKTVTFADGAQTLTIDDAAFQHCIALESVQLPGGLTSIGDWAFNGCKALNGVVLPQKLMTIEPFAFLNCTSLTGIDIPASVTSIGGNAFYGCTALEDVKIYNKSAFLGTYIFSASTNLLTISGYAGSTAETYAEQHGYPFRVLTVPVTVASGTFGTLTWTLDNDGLLTVLGDGAMPDLASMYSSPWNGYRAYVKKAVIGDEVTGIGSYVFYGHDALSEITLGKSVKRIGYQTFANCTALPEITLPAAADTVSYNAFVGCTSLENILVSADNTAYASADGVLFSKDGTVLYLYPSGKTTLGYNVPDGVKMIGDYAFAHAIHLAAVSLPVTVTDIGTYAFSGCTNMHACSMGGHVTSIGDYAFYNCTKLSSINLSSAITSLGAYAFANCASLPSVKIPDGVTEIADHLFYRCTSLASVTLSENVSSVGAYAFYGASALTGLYLPAAVTEIGVSALDKCPSLANISVDVGSTSFSSVDGILFNKAQTVLYLYPLGKTAAAYTIPATVTEIGAGAFKDCKVLTEIVLPSALRTIGEGAFADCDGLTSVEIPAAVETLESYAFAYCDNLLSVTVPASVTLFGDYAFGACTKLRKAVLETRMAEFGEDVFLFASGLFVMYGYAGTTAETYAEDHLYTYMYIGAQALPESVLFGTPVIDGRADALYSSSVRVTFDGTPSKNAFREESAWDDAAVTTYALYDDTYVYLCAVVTDNDVVQPDASYYQKWNAYGIDGVEFRLNFADCADTSKQFKVTVDAHGVNAFTIQPTICDITGVLYETSLTSDGYIIEIAVPHSTNENNQLLDAGALGFNMWLVDLQASAAGAASPVQWTDFYMYGMDFGYGNGVAAPFALSEEEADEPPAPELPEGSVLIGTPEIDGVLDAAYSESLSVTFDGTQENNAFNTQSAWDDATVTTYALYDDAYVYLCAVVTDNDVVKPAESHYTKWNANGIDGVEFRLNFGDCNDSSKQFKITADAHGLVKSNGAGSGNGCFTIQPDLCDISKVICKSTLTADGYIIEIAVPHSTNENNQLLDAGALGFNMWLIDLQASAAGAANPVQWTDYYMYGMDFGYGNGVAVPFALSSESAEEEIEKFAMSGASMTLGNELSLSFFFPVAKIPAGEECYVVVTKEYADGRADVT
ncbi:MAG: leucine-rich repeat protein, partial [Clostridia bacterium]|nr:leucine-rich repeat protein [Clostridia bacterium]